MIRLLHWVFKRTLSAQLWLRWCEWRYQREQEAPPPPELTPLRQPDPLRTGRGLRIEEQRRRANELLREACRPRMCVQCGSTQLTWSHRWDERFQSVTFIERCRECDFARVERVAGTSLTEQMRHHPQMVFDAPVSTTG